ncbi:outer membrane beta-barrel protein [Hydrogenimonas thermophila]|uniref:outer membrane beta-barrel protein n=1 Tax=Hydrogenimonas thermophila TaxID=223786 RepID=UPI002936FE7C|nr:outer membrane beta-barrel protein [Hydrogenimonas thermophila]WOE70782.1 outer membrane beta-barrel protein [Hydrogenimonas thermophila]WOE73300.1 outer membrane beta-barrel protein [Hydrogenimonas thermophila]
MKVKTKATAILFAASLPFSLQAGEVEDLKAQMMQMQKRLAELEKKQKQTAEASATVVEELAALQNEGLFQAVDITKSHSGLGAAASKVYYTQNPLSIGGYGEMYWADSSDKTAITDVYRFVPYIGYKFNDWIVLNTELEFEHGGNEVAVEFMYLDFLLDNNYNIRVGNQLVPMGLVNQRHEPTLFPTVQRPETETLIIPSTWHETGVIVYGELGMPSLTYHLGFINALNVNSDDTKIGNIKWLRNGRWGSSEKAPMGKVAVTGRLDYSGIDGLTVGVSAYYGNGSNRDIDNVNGTSLFIYDLHAIYRYEAVTLKGLFTQAMLDDAEKIGPDAVEEAEGYYLTAEYDIMSHFNNKYRLPIFVQYENYNPVKETVSGIGELDDIENITFGLNFYPHEQVVLKTDYQIKDRNDGSDEEETLSVGIGFIF